MIATPFTCREVRLKTCPTGLPEAHHFEVVAAPFPTASAGEVLVRNRWFLVSASLRQMVSEGAENVPGVPFPALRPGDALLGEALGEVLVAPPNSGLSRGDMVRHTSGWRDVACVPVDRCRRLTAPLPEPLGWLGHLGHGWTAYAALTRGVRIRQGDRVFIAGAAGAIGTMAGQIARLLGAGRVIGSTSSHAKAHRLVTELSYDDVVIRDVDTPFEAQLAKAAPHGIDIVLDNVGGEQLRAAVNVASPGARLLIVGALSGQLAETGTGRTAPVELDSTQILIKRLTLRGYSADDHPSAHDEWLEGLETWVQEDRIRFPHVVVHGLEHAVDALCQATRGHYLGTVIVAL